MHFSYYSQVEEARLRQEELMRAAKAARQARDACNGQITGLRRIWQFVVSGARLSRAKPAFRANRRTKKFEKRVGAQSTLQVRTQD